MIASNVPPAPSWVRKRDGRLVPFDADRICRALFAASESAGRPDAFLARELADVAVHFLAEETEGTTPTTEQVRETVVKVLRQLRQHALASAFHDRAPKKPPADEIVLRCTASGSAEAVSDECLRAWSLRTVFTPELAAAHQDGLITLVGLETPHELHAAAAGAIASLDELLPRLEETARVAGQVLAVEGIERLLAGTRRASRQRLEEGARRVAGMLVLASRMSRRTIVVNLNGPPPPWAEGPAVGPLFGDEPGEPAAEGTSEVLARTILESNPGGRVRIDWHLTEKDFLPEAVERLQPLVRALLAGAAVSFVFDSPRRSVSLAEGVDSSAGVLLAVGLKLPRIAAMLQQEGDTARGLERLPDKLRSLARLALSAALRKRERLRQRAVERPELASGFLLDRARVLVAPLGLDDAVQTLLGQRMCAADAALDLGAFILTRLRDILREEGRASALETCIDALPGHEAAGPTCWDHDVPVKAQLRALGMLHMAAGGGGGTAFLPNGTTPEQVVGWLRRATHQTSAARLTLAQPRPPLTQMTFE